MQIYNSLFEENGFFQDRVFFDYYRYSDCYSLSKLAGKITGDLIEKIPTVKQNRDKARQYISQILCNLIYAYDLQKCVVISRDKNAYNNTLIKYSLFLKILDFMIEQGYVKQKLGYKDFYTGKGKKTCIWSSEKMVQIIKENNLTAENIKSRQIYSEIILKDDEKKVLRFAETEETRELRQRIHKINLAYLKSSFTIREQNFYPRISAIYNNSNFECCGRLYNKSKQGLNYQGISSTERQQIKINGEDVIQLDYKALHITMLYQLEGQKLQGDPYNFIEDRKTAKKVIYRIFNCSHLGRLLYGLNQEDSSIDWINVVTRAKERHSKIKKFFGSGVGVKLMNIDSKIMLGILERCIDEGIIALGLHDSIIIPSRYEEEGKRIMQEEYRKIMGYGISIQKK